MDNDQIAAIFYEVADILDIQGVAFKPNAYRRAARSIESLDQQVSELAAEGKLKEIPGVGESMAKKLEEIVRTGELSYLNKLRAQIPAGLLEILGVPDVGPKTAMILWKELGITNLEELKKAAAERRLSGLKGFGEKSEERILQGIATLESKGKRMLLGEAFPLAESIVEHLRRSGKADRVSPAGSLRRGKETVGDIDILVGDNEPAPVMDAFVAYPEVREVLMRGPTKCSIIIKNGVQVDLRVVEGRSWGAALQYFTGSKEHNVEMRKIGVQLGLKLNEYGVFERETDNMIAGATEEEVYKVLGMAVMPPEIRENAGEIEAARKGTLPKLVEQGDMKGDLHVHTDWSDGVDSVNDMTMEAVRRGYHYLAITDHSQSLKIAGGLTPARLRKQVDEVRKVDERLGGKVKVLSGTEVDIKADGSLDFDKSVLKDVDIAVGSVHSRFKMSHDEMTERLVAAIETGDIDILGHPSGRLIGERAGYQFDFEKVAVAARETGVALELNSFPNRLDLSDTRCRAAKDLNVRVAICTDAHRTDEMDFIRYGVITARRGWLEKRDVVNAKSSKDVVAWLRRR